MKIARVTILAATLSALAVGVALSAGDTDMLDSALAKISSGKQVTQEEREKCLAQVEAASPKSLQDLTQFYVDCVKLAVIHAGCWRLAYPGGGTLEAVYAPLKQRAGKGNDRDAAMAVIIPALAAGDLAFAKSARSQLQRMDETLARNFSVVAVNGMYYGSVYMEYVGVDKRVIELRRWYEAEIEKAKKTGDDQHTARLASAAAGERDALRQAYIRAAHESMIAVQARYLKRLEAHRERAIVSDPWGLAIPINAEMDFMETTQAGLKAVLESGSGR